MGVRVALTTLLDTSSETDRKHNSNKRDEALTKVTLEYTGACCGRKARVCVCAGESDTVITHNANIDIDRDKHANKQKDLNSKGLTSIM